MIPHVIERYLVSLGAQEQQGLALSDLEKDLLKVCRYTVELEGQYVDLQKSKSAVEITKEVFGATKPRLAPSSTLKGKRGKR